MSAHRARRQHIPRSAGAPILPRRRDAHLQVVIVIDGWRSMTVTDPLDFLGLCGCEGPCSLDLADFCVGGLSWAGAHKTSGDEGAA